MLTDDEIDNAKTIGDMKTLYSKLVDNYKKYAQDIEDQIPESLRSKYTQQVEPALKTLDESKLNLIQHFQLVVQMIRLFLNKGVLFLYNN